MTGVLRPIDAIAAYRRAAIATFAAFFAAFASAAAADDDWSLEVTPYAWLVAVDGAAVPSGSLAPIDLDIGVFDLIDGVRFGAMGAVEIRRGRWAVIADAAYGDFLIDGTDANPTIVGEQLDIEVFLGDALVAWRAMRADDLALDLIAGARLFAPKVRSVIPAGGGALTFDITDQLHVDPVVGARADIRLTRTALLRLYADVGGGGVSSDLTWQTFGGVSVALGKTISLSAGYRIVAWRFAERLDDPLRKLKGSGPLLALTLRF